MKVYVASSLLNIEDAAQAVKLVQQAGHEVTFDWTKVIGTFDVADCNALKSVALFELHGAMDADVLLLLMPAREGSHVELGAALAGGKRVIMIGDANRVVSFHTLCERASDVKTAINMIGQ